MYKYLWDRYNYMSKPIVTPHNVFEVDEFASMLNPEHRVSDLDRSIRRMVGNKFQGENAQLIVHEYERAFYLNTPTLQITGELYENDLQPKVNTVKIKRKTEPGYDDVVLVEGREAYLTLVSNCLTNEQAIKLNLK